jgi:thioredoxin reductase/bacterioferritin-associated ferredoxin
MTPADVVIVGGGPAGMAAAATAAEAGASAAVVDDCAEPGGKVLKQGRAGMSVRHTDRIEASIGRRMFRELDRYQRRIRWYDRSEVWDLSADNTVFFSVSTTGGQRLEAIRGRRLILCTGALERVMPFEGWDLPGVFGVGGLNTLVKRGVVPGRRFVVAGSGPLPLVLTRNLLNSGARVAAMVSAVSIGKAAAQAPILFVSVDPYKLAAGMLYIWTLRRHRVPVLSAAAVTRAMGDGVLSSVIVQNLDRSWAPLPKSRRQIRVDAAAVTYGLVPATELTRLRGCRHVFDTDRGYWRVVKTRTGETDLAGVFAAGDGVSVKGYVAAAMEGRAAAIEACAQLGFIDRRLADRRLQPLVRRLAVAARFGRSLDMLARPGPGLIQAVSDATVVCRCEDVTAGDIRRSVANGARDIHEVKRTTRLGMGHCQGRFCGQVVNELLWRMTGNPSPREIFTPRSPVRPVNFGIMADTLNHESEDRT